MSTADAVKQLQRTCGMSVVEATAMVATAQRTGMTVAQANRLFSLAR